jgi:Tfp pilus assembly PilM family ATPase
VILGGGSSRLENLDAFLSHELGLPVVLASPLERSQHDPADFPAEFVRDAGPSMIVAAGLGRRDLPTGAAA